MLPAAEIVMEGSPNILTACGDDAGSTDGTGTSSSSTGASSTTRGSTVGTVVADGAFPVTVAHTFGETVIEARPERIACVDTYEADVVLALGIEPVAISFFDGYDDGIPPWQAPLIGGAAPVVLTYTDGYDIESTAGTRPDLILGSYVDEATYELLAGIAPTVVLDYASDIRDRVRTVGAAVGMPDEAEGVVTTYDGALAAAADSARLTGRTVAAVVYYGDGVLSNATDDDSFSVLAALGAVPSPAFDGIEPYADVGLERIDLLDADFLFVVYGVGMQDSLEANPLFKALPVVQDGRYLGTEDTELDVIAARGVLQVPHALERFVPAVQALGLP